MNPPIDRRSLLAATLGLALAGCAPRRSTAGPMQRIVDEAPCPRRPDALLVFLPGARDTPSDLIAQGFARAVRERGLALDLWLVDAHLGYYVERSILQRLDVEVIAPARAAGYRTIVLAGISVGGFGSLAYTSTHPQQVQRVIALAPWLGPRELVIEIGAAGSLARWLATGGASREVDGDATERALWRWLHERGARPPSTLHLGYGASDRFADGHRLLAAALPAPNVLAVPGGHDWPAWRVLWQRMLDGPAFAAIARGC